jgi:hypothetical protein
VQRWENRYSTGGDGWGDADGTALLNYLNAVIPVQDMLWNSVRLIGNQRVFEKVGIGDCQG